MIISKINTKKSKISMLLLSMFVYGVIEPPVAYALTSGPTSPEASSFEPIDTTDMVNPMTGSFTYNTPILEVPGPGGGYPLSMSYHAGVSPELESSWVGLGWNINPGAINRHVAGFPDDFKDVSMRRRDYWGGGSTTTLGITVGYANMVSAGLTFSSDTYRGFGIGANAGFGLNLGDVGSLGLNVGISPYDGSFNGAAGMALNLGIVQVGAGVGYSGSSGTFEPYKSVSLSYSMATGDNSNNKPSMRIGGAISVLNSKSGNLSTDSKGVTLPIVLPNGMSLSLSFNKTRYWSDETDLTYASGTIYTPVPGVDFTSDNDLAAKSGDAYRLLDPDQESIGEKRDFPHKQLGGMFPEYDHYTVLGQGTGGSIKPYLFQRQLFTQKIARVNNYYSTGLPIYANNYDREVGFRFENDFSNAYLQPLNNISWVSSSNPYIDGRLEQFPFGNPTGHESKVDNRLPGSQHIEYYTNEKIRSGTAKNNGFIDVSEFTFGFNRLQNGMLSATKADEQIGGFSITNSSGVTYHYALPAYSYNELSYSKSNNENRFSYTERNEPYAYTWHLTAITGPDFVDRNPNGKPDAGDWGYWVCFDYGKWTEDYRWRNPGLTDHKDLDNDVDFFSRGRKEIYYLNAIRTATHFALFEKDIRIDGKGSSTAAFSTMEAAGSFDATSFPLLKLNKMYLFDIKDLELFTVSGYPSLANSTTAINSGFSRVFDISDVDQSHIGRTAFESRALRCVQLEQDYSLMKNTPNSFALGAVGNKQGKLTLKSVAFKGKEGVQIVPSTKFQYGLETASQQATFTNATTFQASSSSGFEVGDMIETTDERYAGVIVNITGLGSPTRTYYLKNGSLSISGTTSLSVRRTKNPTYLERAVDLWGYYKSDFDNSILALNANLAKRTTEISQKGTDVWCLRRISTPLGADINIDYESGSYSKDVLGEHPTVVVNSAALISGNNRFRLYLNSGIEHFLGGMYPNATYSIGDNIKGIFLTKLFLPPTTLFNFFDSESSGTQVILENGSDVGNYIDVLLYPGTSASILTGNIRVNKPSVIFGGGIRTKSISVRKWDGAKTETNYTYNKPNQNISSGVTAYSPYYLDADLVNSHISLTNENHVNLRNAYRSSLYKNMNRLLHISRELPPPSVTYEYVSIANKSIQKNGDYVDMGKTLYQYRVFDERMVQYISLQNNPDVSAIGADYSYYNKTIKNYTSSIGDLRSVTHYDKDNRMISKIENSYLYDDALAMSSTVPSFNNSYDIELATFNNQGKIIERFGDYRDIRGYRKQSEVVNERVGVMASKENFPSILVRNNTEDYLTNQNSETRNVAFDFLSGSITKSIEKDNLGNRYLTENIPAFRKYPIMGLKLLSLHKTNKNMLTQLAGTYVYKIDASNNPVSLLSASTTLWDNMTKILTPENQQGTQQNVTTGDIWRKRASFTFAPNSASYPNGAPVTMGAFQWNVAPSYYENSSVWSLQSEVTFYNTNSEILEQRDINNDLSSSRYGYGNSKVILSSAGAGYYESVYSGAEDSQINTTIHDRGLVLQGDATVVGPGVIAAHTGSKSLQLTNGQKGFVYQLSTNKLVPERDYHAAVWIYGTPATLAGSNTKLYYKISTTEKGSTLSTGIVGRTAGNWTLMYLPIKGADIIANTILEVGVLNSSANHTAYVDDFRFYPKGSMSNAYVYDQWGEMTHTLNVLNLFTRYEYDAMGRLKAVYLEQFGKQPYKVSEHEYKYAKPI